MSLDKTKLCKALAVKSIKRETPDAATLVLSIPTEFAAQFKYKAGQFVSFFIDINGEEVRRSYSLASSPDWDQDFAVTVKLVPGGKASTFLTQKLHSGDTLWTTPPAGHFCLPESITAKKIVFFAAGSGITPIYSLIKSTLKLHPQVECILIYQNKNAENTIYLPELTQLAQTHAGHFKLELIFSSPDSNWPGMCGRLSSQQIESTLLKYGVGIQSLHFMCGPDAFMNTVSETLTKMNLPKERIFRESFTAGTSAPLVTNENTSTASEFTIKDSCILIGDKTELAECQQIEVHLDGENKTVPYLKDSTVLESLIEAGMNPPYSCMDGACMACIAKVESGSVFQNDLGILTDDNVEAKECLTCQARPASKKVKINFSVF